MPTEVWVAVVGLLGLVLGYFLRPLGELSADALRERLAKDRRRDKLQRSTLIGLGEALETWRVARNAVGGNRLRPREHVRLLTFRVRDEQLRTSLEDLLTVEDTAGAWDAAHGEAIRRLGQVIRDL